VTKRAVLLVDHGSRRAEANAVLEQVAALLRERLPDDIVRVAHLALAPPSLTEGIDACVSDGAREIVVHPYFLAPGDHAAGGVPDLVAEAAARHPGVSMRVTPPLGVHPALLDVILARIGEA
jgi:sirohydrochlorin ferrochelatase